MAYLRSAVYGEDYGQDSDSSFDDSNLMIECRMLNKRRNAIVFFGWNLCLLSIIFTKVTLNFNLGKTTYFFDRH
jgi:hypothetical protein